jgi:dTDP-glucose pyrophosphorylase
MLNIVIPMAGEGSRFKEKGYTFPKPLIEINGKPMLQVIVENIRPRQPHTFTFICRKEHYEKYSLHALLTLIAPACNVVTVSHLTEGAACTVLLAAEHFNNDAPLMIANSDQFVDFDINRFLDDSVKRNLDGNILTFHASHPKWSYAKLDEDNLVMEVAEKRPISTHATVGIYYYRTGKMFFDAATSMIEKNIRINNEFYVCPVYNEMILSGQKISIYEIDQDKMHGLGTPEDLEKFEKCALFPRI